MAKVDRVYSFNAFLCKTYICKTRQKALLFNTYGMKNVISI